MLRTVLLQQGELAAENDKMRLLIQRLTRHQFGRRSEQLTPDQLQLTRKNALFAGSDGGAKHWALAMTLIQTAKLNGVDPMAWLTDVLERIVSGRTKAHEMSALLPWTWAETHASPEAISIAA